MVRRRGKKNGVRVYQKVSSAGVLVVGFGNDNEFGYEDDDALSVVFRVDGCRNTVIPCRRRLGDSEVLHHRTRISTMVMVRIRGQALIPR
ncbi:hypothetical protein U1Q18_021253 [Sarracenia purpurea var. burkii]